jgi:hypothetical protein
MRAFLIALSALLVAPAANAQSVSDLTWLKGCWRTEAPREAENGSQTTEVWIDPPGPMMVGYSYTEGEGEVQNWEQMRIDSDGGAPRFVAMPGGGAPVAFRMRDTSDVIHTGEIPDGFALFENAEHDYPQRIVYRRDGNALTATISRSNGEDAYVFRYRRISCSAALRP